jgi:uncharacterized protein (TIGR03437 family)
MEPAVDQFHSPLPREWRLFASPDRLNAQVSYALDVNQPALLAVSNGSRVGSPHTRVNVARTDPGIFIAGENRAVAENEDGTLNSSRNPAAAGALVRVYLTGIGIVQSRSLVSDGLAVPDTLLPAVWTATATIGGQLAEIVYIGTAPGTIGLGRADLRVPRLAGGDQPVVITIDGKQSNAALLAVRQ